MKALKKAGAPPPGSKQPGFSVDATALRRAPGAASSAPGGGRAAFNEKPCTSPGMGFGKFISMLAATVAFLSLAACLAHRTRNLGRPDDSAKEAPRDRAPRPDCTSSGWAAMQLQWEVARSCTPRGCHDQRLYRAEHASRWVGSHTKGGQVNAMSEVEEIRYWVGVDWGSEEHQVCVIDAGRNVLQECRVPHRGEALAALADTLLKRASGQAEQIAAAIERPDGAVVETLIERGIAVYAINPKQLDRFRDRHTVAGAKDDRRDAFVLADSLRTDRVLFRAVRLDTPEVIQIRQASRLRDELADERIRTTNRIAEQLRRFYPQVLQLGALDDPWCWDLLELAPTPTAAAKLRPARINRLLKQHRIRRVTPSKVLEILRAQPLTVAPGVPEAASMHVASLLRRLRVTHAEIKNCDRTLAEWVDTLTTSAPVEAPTRPADTNTEEDPSAGQRVEHHDVAIILSLPGAGITVAATMLAEASQALADRDYQSLRLRSGVAPVTLQTGKQRARGRAGGKHHAPPPQVRMRRACNQRLRNAAYHMARVAAQNDAHWKQLYADARARGAKHGAATRIVADRMLKTLTTMLQTGTLYDATRFASPAPATKAA